MDADGRNETDIFRYTDVEYTPDGHSEVYRWEDFLGIAGGHVYSAMDTIDPGRYTAESARGIIVAVGKAPSVSEGAFLFFWGAVSMCMRRARRFPAGLLSHGFL